MGEARQPKPAESLAKLAAAALSMGLVMAVCGIGARACVRVLNDAPADFRAMCARGQKLPIDCIQAGDPYPSAEQFARGLK